MVSVCCINGCSSTQYPGCKMSFYKFPSDKKLRKQWMNITGLTENIGDKKICLLHFRNKDLFLDSNNIHLKPNSAPKYIVPPFEIKTGIPCAGPDTQLYDKDKCGDIPLTYEYKNYDEIQGDDVTNLRENKDTLIDKKHQEVNAMKYRCAFCLKSNNLRSLWRRHFTRGQKETYGDMLVKCFAVCINKRENLRERSERICKSCIVKLKDSINFKTQVLTSELFINMQKDTVNLCNMELKQERDNFEVAKTEYLNVESVEEHDIRNIVKYDDDEFNKDDGDKKMNDPIDELNVKAQTGEKSNMTPSNKSAITRNKKKKMYPTNNLLKAVEDVWSKKMTQTQAAKFYQVPRSTIFDLLIKNYGKPPKPEPEDQETITKANSDSSGQEMAKHAANIAAILENSNATPIRCHSDGGYACCFCDAKYHNPNELKSHTIHTHDRQTTRTFTKGKRPSSYFVKLDISFLKCTVCSADINTLEHLMTHLTAHQIQIHADIKNHILPFKFESEELRCVVCGHIFNKFKVLQEHLNTHYPNYVCKVCNAGFVTRMILYNHSRGHDTGVFPCDQCPKVYNTRRKLRSHRSLVHRHSYLVSKCGYCNEKFKSYHRKLEHLTEAHNVAPSTFACKACDRTFGSQAGLRIHRKRDHLMERQYECAVCDMRFFAKAAADTHMLKHSNARLFQCDVCKKSYKRKSTLREHLRIHDNNRRFTCAQCSAAFVQKCSWRGHMRSKHGVIS